MFSFKVDICLDICPGHLHSVLHICISVIPVCVYDTQNIMFQMSPMVTGMNHACRPGVAQYLVDQAFVHRTETHDGGESVRIMRDQRNPLLTCELPGGRIALQMLRGTVLMRLLVFLGHGDSDRAPAQSWRESSHIRY